MTLPMFYEKPVVLDSRNHAELRLEARQDYRFARQTNSVLLTATEYAKACRDYPIVFVQDKEAVFSAAVLGLKDKQNLFVTESGQWNADYVPAYVRRYPFILAPQNEEGSSFAVCIDEKYPGFNTEQGERLFLENGEQTDFLKRALQLLQDYQAHYQQTSAFARRLLDWELLQPLQANVELNSGDKMSLTGFMAVDRKRLQALAPERAAELLRSDEMGCIYYHLLSLNNFGRLVERVAQAA